MTTTNTTMPVRLEIHESLDHGTAIVTYEGDPAAHEVIVGMSADAWMTLVRFLGPQVREQLDSHLGVEHR